ncbi:MAG: hypothetical protein KA821_11345 [Chitinophagaceae bacterium]|nr:hypothetical protein [Chitinophagaceae bacterium]
MKVSVQILLILTVASFWACNRKPENASSGYSYYKWAEYLHYNNKTDSAYLMFSRAVSTTTDSLEKGKACIYLGIMQRSTGDLYGALASLTTGLTALNAQKSEHHKTISSIYNELGNTCLDLKRYDEAIGYYDSGIKFTTDTADRIEIMNGKATALQKEGNYTKAILLYDSILRLNPANSALTARVISNRARTRWLQNSGYPVLNDYWHALMIRLDIRDNPGLNASYAHLSDYYAALHRDSALWYAGKMYEKATEIESPDDQLEAMDKLIRLNQSTGIKEQWYERFKKLNDSLQMSRDTTRSRFALIQYEVQKSKADNLQLQQHITRQRIIMYSLAVAAVLVIAGLTIWYRQRRKRMRQAAANELRELKLKTSKKVHDVVANGLYTIMNEIEHAEDLERESLTSKIERLYEKSRDISYDDEIVHYKDHDRQVYQLIDSFSNADNNVFVIGNEPVFWNKISTAQKHELLLIINELLVNMKKHSGAKNAVIQFKIEKGTCFVSYKDDGIGFSAGMEFGNGLRNTVSRIKSMNGEVIFGKSEKDGASVTIQFPLQPIKYD